MNEKGYTLYIVEGDLVRKYNTEEFQKREITIGSANTDILVEANTISKVHLRYLTIEYITHIRQGIGKTKNVKRMNPQSK